MTPGAGVFVLGCGHISHIVKMHYFFKNLFSLLPLIDQTNYVYSMSIGTYEFPDTFLALFDVLDESLENRTLIFFNFFQQGLEFNI